MRRTRRSSRRASTTCGHCLNCRRNTMSIGKVNIVEVGPRDGLQNIKEFIPTEHKIAFIERLVNAGCRRIEVASFVRPDLVPQMSDAREVCVGHSQRESVRYSVLIAN